MDRRTPNPPAFTEAVEAYLEHARDQFNYEQMLLTFTSTDRFHQWAQVIRRYRRLEGARVLSSGCGFAGSLLAYHDAGAAVVEGVEVDPEYVRLGRLRVDGLPGVEVRWYDGGALPYPDGAFDVIESMDVIEHTPDDDAYLAELTRVLAPGGLLLLVTPNRLWPVEQHLDIAGPPWLPVRAADALFGALAALPWLSADRRFRYERLRGIRTHNESLRRLRALAKRHHLFLRVLRPADHEGHWPLPRQSPRVEALAQHRFAKFAAPVRTLVCTLEHADARASG